MYGILQYVDVLVYGIYYLKNEFSAMVYVYTVYKYYSKLILH